MNIADVIGMYNQLSNSGIEIWLDGGWGVDALLGEQTRPHSDLDIVVRQDDVPRLVDLLAAQGYKDVPRNDTRPWNFVLGDDHGRLLDVHAVVFDVEGNGLYGPPENGVMYPAGSLTGTGVIDGHTVKCVSAEYAVKFHSAYEPDEMDVKDVTALCARFGIDLPDRYASLKK